MFIQLVYSLYKMKADNSKLLLKELHAMYSTVPDRYDYEKDTSEIEMLESQLKTAYENIDKLKDILIQLINYLDESNS